MPAGGDCLARVIGAAKARRAIRRRTDMESTI
jgi:hypothetical protein